MSHTKSHIAFFVHCMEVNEAQARDIYNQEIRKEVINRSYQQKYGCELKAIKATNSKISRLNLRGIYGQDPTLF